jgi:hypothetical protein
MIPYRPAQPQIYPAGTDPRNIPASFRGMSWQEYVWHCNRDTPRIPTAKNEPPVTPRKRR